MSIKRQNDALIVGASSGLGLALTLRVLEKTAASRVFATYRRNAASTELAELQERYPGRLELLRCELESDASLDAMQNALMSHKAQLTLTLHAAGILHEPGLQPEKSLKQLSRENLMRVLEINAAGPALIAKAVFDCIPHSTLSHFAALSAMVGSIGDNNLGGWYSYRASKSALNQLMKTLAIEARRTRPNLCVTSIHPGTTDTPLSKPFQARVPPGKLYSPGQSAKRILSVVLSGSPADSGRFMNWDGKELPW